MRPIRLSGSSFTGRQPSPTVRRRNAGTEAKAVAGALTSMRIDELISNMAVGIAEGQFELDQVCMDIAKFMGDAEIQFGNKPGTGEPDILSLVELGFTPNFYQFVETVLEVRLAISSRFEEESTYSRRIERQHETEREKNDVYNTDSSSKRNRSYKRRGLSTGGEYSTSFDRKKSSSSKTKSLHATTIDAKYTGKYGFSVDGSSTIKTKLLPVPPPEILEELIRSKADERKQLTQRLRWIEQVMAILPTIVETTSEAIRSVQDLDPTKIDDATKIKDEIAFVDDTYAQLTLDHWSVISYLRGRVAADEALGRAIELGDQIFEETSLRHSPPGVENDQAQVDSQVDLLDLKTRLISNLSDFKAWITDIQDRFTARADALIQSITPPEQDPPLGETLMDQASGDDSQS